MSARLRVPVVLTKRRIHDLLTGDRHQPRGAHRSGFVVHIQDGWLKVGHEMTRGQASRCSSPPSNEQFLRNYTATLVRHGYVVERPEAPCGSPVAYLRVMLPPPPVPLPPLAV